MRKNVSVICAAALIAGCLAGCNSAGSGTLSGTSEFAGNGTLLEDDEYNKDGKPVEHKDYLDTGIVQGKNVYEYDQYGNLLKMTIYDGEDNIKFMETHEYQYR